MPPQPSFAEHLARFAANTPAAAVEALAAALEAGLIGLDTPALEIRELPHVSADKAAEGLAPQISPYAAALFLRAAVRLLQIELVTRPSIEIAWTGPEASGPLVRPTGLVIEEMLRNTRDRGEILIVGYSLQIGDGTVMEKVVGLLEEASKRLANVTFVLHRDEESSNKRAVLRAWDPLVIKPRFMRWDPPPDHPYTKLHAKVLVVDRREALVGSANFTFHGMQSNLELGLRVKGPQAAAIAERFDHLIASGTIKPWD